MLSRIRVISFVGLPDLLLLVGSCLLSALLLGGSPARGDERAERAFFESRIRPVLVKHCYACHSATAKEVKGGLRLDTAAAVLQGGDSGPAIVPGKPDESPLIAALRYDGVEMPPDARLPKQVVRDFERWVQRGGFDPRRGAAVPSSPRPAAIDLEAGRRFWAFQPVRRHARPPVADRSWPLSDLDAFVQAKLEAKGLAPMPDAEPRALVRRLYFDLLGLPPSPQDVERFLADSATNTAADAWERLVDRLLQSRQFGLHWGRHWLDVARYADSNGGDFNATFHNAWRYRDYVVDAFNRDKPYDVFVREQLAGDLLPARNRVDRAERIIATGFLMVGSKMLSERDKLKLTMDVVDEQLNTVGQALLGMTIGCARCHDHKFDPIPTRDYYALAGIFRSTRTLQGESQQYVSTWPKRPLPVEPAHAAAVKAFEASRKRLQAEIKAARKTQSQVAQRLKRFRSSGRRDLVVDDSAARRIGKWKASTRVPAFVGAGYIHDDRTGKGEKRVEFPIEVTRTAHYEVQVSYVPGSTRAKSVPLRIEHADGIAKVKLNQRAKPPIDGLYASVGKFRYVAGQTAVLTLGTAGTTGFVIADAVRMVELDADGKPVTRKADTNDPQLTALLAEQKEAAASLNELEGRLKELEKKAPPELPRAFAVAEAQSIGDCRICVRGEHENLGEAARRGVLQVASHGPQPSFPAKQSGRLELARWLTDPRHPLTARVFVNRIWHHLLGRGIVASVDNFGRLGERPTHPKLLDRMAADFVADGWSIKRAIRRVVLSRVYRLSTRHDERCWSADPDNRLLWRGHRRRLPAESLRDAMLAISGNLDHSPGGSPVRGLGVLVTQNGAKQKKFVPSESRRRSIYLPVIRNEIPSILAVFDFADPDLVTGRRAVTNVPAQALLLLNSPFVMEQAEQTARRVRKAAPDDTAAQIRSVYQYTLARAPTRSELARATEFVESADATAKLSPLAQLIHTIFASTPFRMLD